MPSITVLSPSNLFVLFYLFFERYIYIYMFNNLDRNKDENDCQLRFNCEIGKSDPTDEQSEEPSRRTESYTQEHSISNEETTDVRNEYCMVD